jgi:hypothetical protein
VVPVVSYLLGRARAAFGIGRSRGLECQAVVLLVVSYDLLNLDGFCQASMYKIQDTEFYDFSFSFFYFIADNVHIQDMWGFVARVTPFHDASSFPVLHFILFFTPHNAPINQIIFWYFFTAQSGSHH